MHCSAIRPVDRPKDFQAASWSVYIITMIKGSRQTSFTVCWQNTQWVVQKFPSTFVSFEILIFCSLTETKATPCLILALYMSKELSTQATSWSKPMMYFLALFSPTKWNRSWLIKPVLGSNVGPNVMLFWRPGASSFRKRLAWWYLSAVQLCSVNIRTKAQKHIVLTTDKIIKSLSTPASLCSTGIAQEESPGTASHRLLPAFHSQQTL